MRKPVFGVSNQVQLKQPQKMVRGLQGQIISLTGLLARVSLKQLKVEFYWLMLPAEIDIYMFTKAIRAFIMSLASRKALYSIRVQQQCRYPSITAV